MEKADNQVNPTLSIEDIVSKLDNGRARFVDQYSMAVIVHDKEKEFLYSFDRKKLQYNYVCGCAEK